ncbi:MAG: hypothetical protein ACXWRE_09215 [Pseudobdellovibrionaceae bacterium]
MNIRIEQLSEKNFADYEALTSCESGGGCYYSFWHQKISSMQERDHRKKENPQLNRQIVLDMVKTGFERIGPHWLSQAEAERSMYRVSL